MVYGLTLESVSQDSGYPVNRVSHAARDVAKWWVEGFEAIMYAREPSLAAHRLKNDLARSAWRGRRGDPLLLLGNADKTAFTRESWCLDF